MAKLLPKVLPDPDGNYLYDNWMCMYAGASAVDDNKANAWAEGVPGSGKGEALIITLLDLCTENQAMLYVSMYLCAKVINLQTA